MNGNGVSLQKLLLKRLDNLRKILESENPLPLSIIKEIALMVIAVEAWFGSSLVYGQFSQIKTKMMFQPVCFCCGKSGQIICDECNKEGPEPKKDVQ